MKTLSCIDTLTAAAEDGESVTISNTSIMYNRHTSGTETPTDEWTSSIPDVDQGEYLWTRTIVTYSDGTSTTAYSVSRQGTDGTSVYQVYKRSKSQPSTPSGTAYPPEGWVTTTDDAISDVYCISFASSWTPSSCSGCTFDDYFEFCDEDGNNTSNTATVDTKYYRFKDGVDKTSIPGYSFSSDGSTAMTYIEIPRTITTIGLYAFNYQNALTSIDFPPSVESVEAAAFFGCASLSSIRFYGNITSIGTVAFFPCSSLTSIELLNATSVPALSSSAFPESTSMQILVPASIYGLFWASFSWSSYTSYLVSSSSGYSEDYSPLSLVGVIWASIANMTNGIISSWGTPFRLEAEDGETGATGAVLRGPQAWSDCDVGYEFQSGGDGESYKDVVLFGEYCYECKTSHTKTATNDPLSDIQSGGGLWQVGQSINLVATYLLMSTYALIENLGASAIEMKDDDGNILVEIKDGNVTCKTGTFENVVISGILNGVTGIFSGSVNIGGGLIQLNSDGSGSFANGKFTFNSSGLVEINGLVSNGLERSPFQNFGSTNASLSVNRTGNYLIGSPTNSSDTYLYLGSDISATPSASGSYNGAEITVVSNLPSVGNYGRVYAVYENIMWKGSMYQTIRLPGKGRIARLKYCADTTLGDYGAWIVLNPLEFSASGTVLTSNY